MKAKTIFIGGAVLVAIAALARSAQAAATPPPAVITTGMPNITAILPSTATMPNSSEIDIDFLWKNTGDAIGSFVPRASIDGGILIDLGAGTIILGPGEIYHAVKAMAGISLIASDSHTVCPVPN